MLVNLMKHWRHYGVVALAVLLALIVCYRRISHEVHRQELIGESLLHLSPRNVSFGRHSSRDLFRVARNEKGVPVVSEQPYVGEETQVTITPLDKTKTLDQVVYVKYKNYGLTHTLGLEATFIPLGLGLDMKWGFCYKLGSTIGVNYMEFAGMRRVTPTMTATYQVYKNTDLLVGYAPLGPLPYYGGFRINF